MSRLSKKIKKVNFIIYQYFLYFKRQKINRFCYAMLRMTTTVVVLVSVLQAQAQLDYNHNHNSFLQKT